MPIYEEKGKVNGQKRYYIRAYVNDEFGKKRQITKHNKEWIGLDGKREAQRQENLLLVKTTTKNCKVTVYNLVKEKIEQDKSYLKQSSIIRYNEFLNIYIKNVIGNCKIDKLTVKNILEWHKWIDTKNIKVETKKKIHNLLRASIDYGIKCYGLNENVCSIIGNFKSKRGEIKSKMQFLTYDEFKKFIQQEENITYKNFFSMLFYTGMRRGELLALTFNDIDFDKEIIKINKSINPKNGEQATVPKTNKSNREIPMLRKTKKILQSINYSDDEIFGLKKIVLTTLTRKCHRNCEMANINKIIRVHDFRHSFVALCVESKTPIEKISEYVGHENISTTYDIYGHLYPSAKKELVNKVDDFLEKQDQKQD